MPKRTLRRQRGFSLIELMFATTILAVTLLSVMSYVLAATRTERALSERAVAKTYVAGVINDLRAHLRRGHTDSNTAFGTVLTEISALNAENSGKGRKVTLRAFGDTELEAWITVETFTTEASAQAAPPTGLGLSSLDLDADGLTGETETLDADTLRALPIRVTVTWKPSDGAGTDRTFKNFAILY